MWAIRYRSEKNSLICGLNGGESGIHRRADSKGASVLTVVFFLRKWQSGHPKTVAESVAGKNHSAGRGRGKEEIFGITRKNGNALRSKNLGGIPVHTKSCLFINISRQRYVLVAAYFYIVKAHLMIFHLACGSCCD